MMKILLFKELYITIQNAKNFILETIECYKILLSDNAQREILHLFNEQILEQVDTVLLFDNGKSQDKRYIS